jgi:hypothetical protein
LTPLFGLRRPAVERWNQRYCQVSAIVAEKVVCSRTHVDREFESTVEVRLDDVGVGQTDPAVDERHPRPAGREAVTEQR